MFHAESQLASINGAELEYFDMGSGPPVLFIHGGMGAECSLILREPLLAERFRLIHFQRRGYGRSNCPEKPVPIAQQSQDAQALLKHLGVTAAHVVGQSYGGAISLQLSMDAPELVRTLTVIEPAIPSVLFASEAFAAQGQQAGALYQNGKSQDAMTLFGKAVIGEDDWDEFAAQWLDSWTDDAGIIFESDMPALGPWNPDPGRISQFSMPVLNLRGASAPEVFVAIWEAISQWVPQARNDIVPDASHCVLQMNPGYAAKTIVEHISAC